MSQILNGRNKKISDELIAKIHSAYPNLSVLWLMFGEGPMMLDENMRFSEAQNASFSTDSDTISPENKPTVSQFSSSGSLFDTQSEKLNPDKNLFTREDSAINNHHSDSAPSKPDMFEERRQYYVRTHELIEFDDDKHSSQAESNTNHPSAQDSPNYSSLNANHYFRQHTHAPETSPSDSVASTTSEQYKSEPSIVSESYNHTETGNPASEKRTISLSAKSDKQITNIVVFYSDNSFQSFYPTMF